MGLPLGFKYHLDLVTYRLVVVTMGSDAGAPVYSVGTLQGL